MSAPHDRPKVDMFTLAIIAGLLTASTLISLTIAWVVASIVGRLIALI